MNTVIYKIKEFISTRIVYGTILIAWIIFALYMIETNPIFFGITIIIAILIMLFLTDLSLEVTNESFQIERKRILPFMNKIEFYSFKEIEQIEYLRKVVDKKALLLNIFIEYIPGTISHDAKLVIKYKTGETEELFPVGNRKQNEKLVLLINEKIKTTYNNK